MMAGPFVSKQLVAVDVRFYLLFSNFCEHFVSNNRQQMDFHKGVYFGVGRLSCYSAILYI